MRLTARNFLILIKFIFLLDFFNGFYLAQTKDNSIIKLFCLDNFKEEMLKANISYNKEIANNTCECYLDEFARTRSHQKAISKCKSEAQKKFNL